MKRRIISLVIAVALVLTIMPQTEILTEALSSSAGTKVLEGGQRDFIWPVPGNYGLSSCFNESRSKGSHSAIDIPASKGTTVVASYPGIVVATYSACTHNSSKTYTCCNDGFGNYVVLEHNYKLIDGSTIVLYSRYSHLTAVSVATGDTVDAGTKVGTIGSTGYSQGNHLDFQILKGGWKPFRTYSIDPYVNELLELPTNLYVGSTSSCCGVGPSGCCCYYYVQDIKSIYAIPLCSHPSYDSLGVCTSCGAVFDWENTFSADGIGIYKVTTAFTPRTDKPYDAATKASVQISAGTKVEVLGVYENAFGNKWYKFSYNGQNYYVFHSYLEYVSVASLKVTCSDFSPADQAVLEKKAQPVIGTVQSNYPLSAIYAYLDGNHYATWQAGNNSTTQVSLRETDINYALPFSSLSDGKHTIELIAHSFSHDTGVNFHSSVFYMTAKTEEDTRPGKPTLNVSVDEDFVTFTWSATSNTTHYNLWLAKKNGDAEWEEVEQIFYAENGLSRTLEAGEYRAQLLSYNSNAWESDGSDWQHTWADDVFFTIAADTYTVTFDANGGTDAPVSQEVQAGSSMFIPHSIPRYFGWNFKGWALTEPASLPDYQPDEIITPTSDMVLYAVWEAPLQYYGADGYMCSEQIDYHGQGIYIQFWNPYPNTHYVIYGVGDEDNRVYLYDYDGNLLAFNDDGENGRNFELEYCFSSDQWYYIYVDFYNLSSTGELCFNIGRRYTITYDANGGTGAPEDTYRYYGSGALLSTTVPSRDGYTFLGWATSANATSASYQPGDGFTQSVDTTLYAVWEGECESNGHNYIYQVTTEPTTSAAGTLAGTCSNCSETTVVTLPRLNTTDYSYVVKTEPTYTATGVGCYTWKTTAYGMFSFNVELDKLAATGVIVVQNGAATSGGTVTLTVELQNNPGVAFLALTPVYDTSVLTLVNVENGSIIRDFDSGDNFTWSASEDTTENGTLLRLTFKVSEDAAPGNYEVRLTFREAYTLMGEDVSFEIKDGTVTVSDILYGDANGDGTVNGKDVLLLRRYMAYYNYDTGTSTVGIFPGGDANGDGVVNGKDVLLMRRYMAYYNYDTGTSSVVLGPN